MTTDEADVEQQWKDRESRRNGDSDNTPQPTNTESDEKSKPALKEQMPHRPAVTENASPEDWLGSNQDPDVLLSIPDLGVDRIHLQVDDLEAHVNLKAKLLDVVDLQVGAHVFIRKVELDIQNVHAQAMLKVNLDPVVEIVKHLVEHPEILTQTVSALTDGNSTSNTDDEEDDIDMNDQGQLNKGEQRSIEGKASASYEEADKEEDAQPEESENDEETQENNDGD